MASRKKTVAPVVNADDILADLANSVASPSSQASPTKDDRLVLVLDGEMNEIYDKFTAADNLMKEAKVIKDQYEPQVEETCINLFAELYVKNKALPENPRIKSKNGTGIFQVKRPIKLNCPQEMSIQETLISVGFQKEIASKIVGTEVLETVDLSVRSLNVLADGSDQEKAVFTKIITFIQTLSKEEKALILEKKAVRSVDENFLARASTYCGSSVSLLKALFTVFKPSYSNSSLKCSGDLHKIVDDATRSEKEKKVKKKA